MMSSYPTLDTLKPGQQAIIFELVGPDATVQRLFEMGLIEGEPVEVIRLAPLGDPMEIRVKSYELSLRRAEARMILVRPKSSC